MMTAVPRTLADTARREAASVQRNAVSTWQADDERHARRDVAAGRDPTAPEEGERVVDRLALHDAVQVEQHVLGSQEESSDERQRVERGDTRRRDRDSLDRQGSEVAVVAGREERRTDGRGHEPAGGASRVEPQTEHRRELLRERRQPTRRGVDAVELGGFEKPAEAAIAPLEERA